MQQVDYLRQIGKHSSDLLIIVFLHVLLECNHVVSDFTQVVLQVFKVLRNALQMTDDVLFFIDQWSDFVYLLSYFQQIGDLSLGFPDSSDTILLLSSLELWEFRNTAES